MSSAADQASGRSRQIEMGESLFSPELSCFRCVIVYTLSCKDITAQASGFGRKQGPRPQRARKYGAVFSEGRHQPRGLH